MKLLSRIGALALLCLALFTGCASPGRGYRPTNVDPDETLLDLYEAYRAGKDSRSKTHNALIYDPERAWFEIQRQAVEFPRHVPTLFTCAAIAYEERQIELSGSYLDALFHVEPIHPEAGVLRSRVALKQGNTSRAREVLEQQIRYTPDHAGLREALAAVLFLQGEHDGALYELELASRLGAPRWRLHFHQGLVAEARGDSDAARSAYRRALDEHPDCREAASRLAGLEAWAGGGAR